MTAARSARPESRRRCELVARRRSAARGRPATRGRLAARLRRATRRRRAIGVGDEGSTLPLIAAFVALALALILVVLAATSLYLERKRLFSLADGAAAAGAESFDLDSAADQAAAASGPRLPPLTDDGVWDAAGDYLELSPHPQLESVRLERADSPDGRSAVVTLSGWWRPPVLTAVVPDGLRLEVTATARSVLS